jgi:hypothetical protein
VVLSTGISPDDSDDLVDSGFVKPDEDGMYRASDIARIRLVPSLDRRAYHTESSPRVRRAGID